MLNSTGWDRSGDEFGRASEPSHDIFGSTEQVTNTGENLKRRVSGTTYDLAPLAHRFRDVRRDHEHMFRRDIASRDELLLDLLSCSDKSDT